MALAPHESIFASKAHRYVLASSVCPAELKQSDTMQVYFSIVASREREVIIENRSSSAGAGALSRSTGGRRERDQQQQHRGEHGRAHIPVQDATESHVS
jgi:hypothetical protein